MNKKVTSIALTFSLLMLGVFVILTTWQYHDLAGWFLMAFFLLMAIAFSGRDHLKGYSYTLSILAVVSLAMYYHPYFVSIGGFKMSKLITPLLQVIMFGMGTALSLADFGRVLKMPKGVLVGVACQFTIMPIVGWAITKLFDFPSEISAGIILIGCCPSGLASNVMSYLARANLALSVTLTAVATMLAPLVTPFLMQLLASEYVAVNFWAMMLDIFKIVIAPVGLGLFFNHFLHGRFTWLDKAMPLVSMLGIALIVAIITASGRDNILLVGPVLVLVALMHNTTGYMLGYWLSRAIRMPEQDCRTIALEVGLQNAGLASGLAHAMGKIATVGLGAAVFAPLMNVTGSSLALWWRAKGIAEGDEVGGETEIELQSNN